MGEVSEQSKLRSAAEAKRRQAKHYEREANRLDREADEMDRPRVMFESAGTMTVTQGQLHFIHAKAFCADVGPVHVIVVPGGLMVTAGDERWLINHTADVLKTEGFDGFDRDWTTK